MFGKNIIPVWSYFLEKRLGRNANDIVEKGLSAYDFHPNSVIIKFADKSRCTFNYAFALINSEKKIAAIFTEHCGYYEFPIHGALVREGEENIYIDEYYEE
jgi:hypothetical protein